METPIELHSVAHRVSHQIPAESEMSRQNRATPPQIKVSHLSPDPPVALSLIRSRQGVRRTGGGYRGTFGSRKRVALQGGIAGRLIFYYYWCWRAEGAAPVKTKTGNNFPRKYQRIPRNYYQVLVLDFGSVFCLSVLVLVIFKSPSIAATVTPVALLCATKDWAGLGLSN